MCFEVRVQRASSCGGGAGAAKETPPLHAQLESSARRACLRRRLAMPWYRPSTRRAKRRPGGYNSVSAALAVGQPKRPRRRALRAGPVSAAGIEDGCAHRVPAGPQFTIRLGVHRANARDEHDARAVAGCWAAHDPAGVLQHGVGARAGQALQFVLARCISAAIAAAKEREAQSQRDGESG